MTDRSAGLSRRTFVSTAAATALAGCTGSSDGSGEPADDGNSDDDGSSRDDGNSSDDGGSGGGSTIIVGPDGDMSFDPEELTVSAGTTVTFEWDSNTHNVVPTSQPSDATWSGETDVKNEGHAYEYTFEVPGTYEYVCEPHEAAGMTGKIVVE